MGPRSTGGAPGTGGKAEALPSTGPRAGGGVYSGGIGVWYGDTFSSAAPAAAIAARAAGAALAVRLGLAALRALLESKPVTPAPEGIGVKPLGRAAAAAGSRRSKRGGLRWSPSSRGEKRSGPTRASCPRAGAPRSMRHVTDSPAPNRAHRPW